MYSWRTLPNGQVEVGGRVPTFTGEARAMLRRQVIDRWGDTARREAVKAGVSVAWVIGMIFAESAGDPTAKSADGGFGLMQLTSPQALDGHTGAKVLSDPRLNIELGCRLISRITRKGDTLVEVASKYNAGAARDGSPHRGGEPWGYRETEGHIARVVAASNTAVEVFSVGAPQSGVFRSLPKASNPLGTVMTILSIVRFLK